MPKASAPGSAPPETSNAPMSAVASRDRPQKSVPSTTSVATPASTSPPSAVGQTSRFA